MSTKLNIVRKAITGTATKIFDANLYAKFREFENLDTATDIAWGDSTVTFATGHIMHAGAAHSMESERLYNGELYAITAGGSVNISAVEY